MRFHIDTDLGVDDALALVAAFALFDDAILGISTGAGNVPLDVATRSTLTLLSLLGRRNVPVYKGAAQASDGRRINATDVHGDDGLGMATRQAGVVIEESELAALPGLDAVRPLVEGQLTLIALGPATNIPALVAGYGREAIAQIVLMTGVFFDKGNISEWAEFNAFCDPAALRDTLALGLPVRLVPLDLCRKIQLPRAQLDVWRARSASPLATLLTEAHAWYMDHYRRWEGIEGCFPHDTIAVLAAAEPNHFVEVKGAVALDCSAERRGQTTIEIAAAGPTSVAFGGDLKRIREWIGALPIG